MRRKYGISGKMLAYINYFFVILQPKSIYYYVKAKVYIYSGAVFDGKYQ